MWKECFPFSSVIPLWCLLLLTELSTTGTNLMHHVSQKGSFDTENWSSKPSVPTCEGTAIGAAIAARVVVPPGEKRDIVFSLAWDSPEVKFLKGKSYHRYDLRPYEHCLHLYLNMNC